MSNETVKRQEPGKDAELLRLEQQLAARRELKRRREAASEQVKTLEKAYDAEFESWYGGRAARAMRRKVATALTVFTLLQSERSGGPGSPSGLKEKAKEISYQKPKPWKPAGTTVQYPTTTDMYVAKTRIPDVLASLPLEELNKLDLSPEERAAVEALAPAMPLVRVPHEADTLAAVAVSGPESFVVSDPDAHVPAAVAVPGTHVRDNDVIAPIETLGADEFAVEAPTVRVASAAAPELVTVSGVPAAAAPLSVFPEHAGAVHPNEKEIESLERSLRATLAKKAAAPGRIAVEYENPADDPRNNPTPRIEKPRAETNTSAPAKAVAPSLAVAPKRIEHFRPGYVDMSPTEVPAIVQSEFPRPPLGDLTAEERKIYDRTHSAGETNRSTDTARSAVDRRITEDQKKRYVEDREATYKMVPMYDSHGRKIGEREVIATPFHKGFGTLETDVYKGPDSKHVQIEGGFVVPGVLDALIDRPTWHALQQYGLESQWRYMNRVETKEDIGPWFMWVQEKGVILTFTHDNKLKGEHPILGGKSGGDELNTYTTEHVAGGMTTPAGEYLIKKATTADLEKLKGQFGHGYHKDLWIMLIKGKDGRWLNQGIAIHGELAKNLAEQEENIHSADASKHGSTIGCGRLTESGIAGFKALFKSENEGGQTGYFGSVLSRQRGHIRLPDGTMAVRSDDAFRKMIRAGVDRFTQQNPVDFQLIKEEIVEQSRQEREKHESYVRDPKAEDKIRLEVKKAKIDTVAVPAMGDYDSEE